MHCVSPRGRIVRHHHQRPLDRCGAQRYSCSSHSTRPPEQTRKRTRTLLPSLVNLLRAPKVTDDWCESFPTARSDPSILKQFRNEFVRSGWNPDPSLSNFGTVSFGENATACPGNRRRPHGAEIDTIAVPQPSLLYMRFIAQTSHPGAHEAVRRHAVDLEPLDIKWSIESITLFHASSTSVVHLSPKTS